MLRPTPVLHAPPRALPPFPPSPRPSSTTTRSQWNRRSRQRQRQLRPAHSPPPPPIRRGRAHPALRDDEPNHPIPAFNQFRTYQEHILLGIANTSHWADWALLRGLASRVEERSQPLRKLPLTPRVLSPLRRRAKRRIRHEESREQPSRSRWSILRSFGRSAHCTHRAGARSGARAGTGYRSQQRLAPDLRSCLAEPAPRRLARRPRRSVSQPRSRDAEDPRRIHGTTHDEPDDHAVGGTSSARRSSPLPSSLACFTTATSCSSRATALFYVRRNAPGSSAPERQTCKTHPEGVRFSGV